MPRRRNGPPSTENSSTTAKALSEVVRTTRRSTWTRPSASTGAVRNVMAMGLVQLPRAVRTPPPGRRSCQTTARVAASKPIVQVSS